MHHYISIQCRLHECVIVQSFIRKTKQFEIFVWVRGVQRIVRLGCMQPKPLLSTPIIVPNIIDLLKVSLFIWWCLHNWISTFNLDCLQLQSHIIAKLCRIKIGWFSIIELKNNLKLFDLCTIISQLYAIQIQH